MTDIIPPLDSPSTKQRYVPPHKRNQISNESTPSSIASASSSRHPYSQPLNGPTPLSSRIRNEKDQNNTSYRSQYNSSDDNRPRYNNSKFDPQRRSQSRTSHIVSKQSKSEYHSESNTESEYYDRSGPSNYRQPSRLTIPNTNIHTSAQQTPIRRSAVGSPSLFVFGDSFVGPLKLLSEECVGIRTFKGASAKKLLLPNLQGLNNPNSLKQVSKDLLPALNDLLAPPPYKYIPHGGRWAMLVFGNVDLQINYLWQLQHKTISSLSFSETEYESVTTRPSAESLLSDDDDDDDDDNDNSQKENIDDHNHPIDTQNILANATDTSLKGPALGPELFVRAVAKAYISWLEREIVNGPIGERIRSNTPKLQSGNGNNKRQSPNNPVLIAAALPPLVEDRTLSRIPEKYVERLEEEHEKKAKLMRRSSNDSGINGDKSRTPWARSGAATPVEVGLSTLSITDDPSSSPKSTISSSTHSDTTSSEESTLSVSDTNLLSQSTVTTLSSISDNEQLPPKSISGIPAKTTIDALLSYRTPLCTLPTRVRMTNLFNELIGAFCAQHPTILQHIDISPHMHSSSETSTNRLCPEDNDENGEKSQDDISGSFQLKYGEVDRSVWACPVDPTNIHPVWEATLPLWLTELERVGVPTKGFELSEDAEETFKAYEVDKRRRTENREKDWATGAGGRGEKEGGTVGRVLREE